MNSYCEQVLHQLKQKDASQPEFREGSAGKHREEDVQEESEN